MQKDCGICYIDSRKAPLKVRDKDLLNQCSRTNLRELDELRGEKNFNNIRYTDDAVSIVNSEEKLKVILDKAVKERLNKGLTINLSGQWIFAYLF